MLPRATHYLHAAIVARRCPASGYITKEYYPDFMQALFESNLCIGRRVAPDGTVIVYEQTAIDPKPVIQG